MALALYGQPLSSYTQQVLIALYENATPFEFRCISPDRPQHLADCAAALSLFHADWTHRAGELYAVLRAHRARLLARTSVALAVDEARPFWPLFPLEAPERD